MNEIISIRPIIFIVILTTLLLLQIIIPSRKMDKKRIKFMISNTLIVITNNFLILLLPLIPLQMAMIAKTKSFGILNIIGNYLLEIPLFNVIFIILGIVILDIVIYFQHRLFHQVDFLWKIHSMHHIDPLLDVTSGLRFHPIEIFISNIIKVSAVFIIGISPLSVLIFEVGLNSLAMFNHSNIKISPTIEKYLNKILITPALHTIHHSKILKETNSNYGFSVPWWDKLFHTFTPQGKYKQEEIRIGIVPMPKEEYQLMPKMLIQPFVKTDKND